MIQKHFAQLPRFHKTLILGVLACVTLLLLLPSEPASASRDRMATELELHKRYPLTLNADALALEALPGELDQQWHSYRVNKGDNLAKIFSRAGLSPKDVYQVSRAGKAASKLLKLMPGDEIRVLKDASGQFASLGYRFSATEELVIKANDAGLLESHIHTEEIQTRLNFAQGEITTNFWNAARDAGLKDNQIMSLADLFGWDIDFALEIRKGDQFYVVFEEQYLNGDYLGPGDIVAAEFINQGETFTAMRHDDGRYYTPEGRSMRKSFLRAPVNFKYISSNFTKRRFHPVQKRWKAHRGVDYAADRGTPVLAAGDGKVIKSAYDKYNGHHVFIQHGEKYVTKYLHFTKRKVRRGQSVKQGQVIGTVGATGLASGPHLHYEFLVDGVHRNPRTVKLPKAQPIARKEKSRFMALAAEYRAHLDTHKRIMLAMR